MILTTLLLTGSMMLQTPASLSKDVKVKLVTTGYIRQHAPETFARIVAAGGRGSQFARPFELKALDRKKVEVARYDARQPKPRFQPDGKVEPPKTQSDSKPMFITGLKVKQDYSWLQFFTYKMEESNFAADYGDVVKGSTSVGHYDGVAPKDGVITVSSVKGGPMVPKSIRVFNGEWKDGKPVVEGFDMVAPLSAKVKAGQEYRVEFALDTSKLAPGTYKGKSDIDDGNLIHVDFSANVINPNGGFNYSFGTGAVDLATGQSADLPITIKVGGNTPETNIKVRVINAQYLNSKGVSIYGDTQVRKFKDGQSGTMVLTFKGGNAADFQGTIDLEISGYDGAASAIAKIPVNLHTIWVDTDGVPISGADGDVTSWMRLRFNSLGDYDFSWSVENHANFTRYTAWAYAFPVAASASSNSRFSLRDVYQLQAQKLPGSSSHSRAITGQSAFIRNNFFQFAGQGVKLWLLFSESQSNDLKAAWKLVDVDGNVYPW